MKASFSYAIRYRITATCRSPLRTGDAANNPDRILTTHEGFAMLPGSSIAGAMKAWLGRDQRTAALFGSQKQESAVRISDALFREEDLAVTRPRIRIDRETGAAADEAKFDVTALPAGSVCSFELLWRGKKEEARSAAEIIERCLGAVNSGEISFGAQKNNGYGQMSLEITASEYDLFQKQDRLAWLDDRPNRKRTVTPPKNEMTDIVFSVEKCHAAVLVKAAAARRDDKKSIQTQFKENGRTIIPSSSLKGVMRTHMELIAPFLSVSKDTLTALFGKVPSREEKQKKLFGTEEQKQEASAGRKVLRRRRSPLPELRAFFPWNFLSPFLPEPARLSSRRLSSALLSACILARSSARRFSSFAFLTRRITYITAAIAETIARLIRNFTKNPGELSSVLCSCLSSLSYLPEDAVATSAVSPLFSGSVSVSSADWLL